MIEKLECTCIEAYKTRKMRDPNCCACSCDHNDLVEQLADANEQNQQLLTYLEDAHSHIGHLASHLAGRITDGARFEMAKRADIWRDYCEQLRKEQSND